MEQIKIHGPALEGNLEGDAVDRDVLVFLPPSYAKQKSRRYPVLYALHGYSIGAEQWAREIHVPQTIEGAFAQGAQEMIVVLPDSKTLHNGSMYSSSVTTGDFENFIAHDLVAYIDAHYRTLPNRESRGLVGHSMGGYGATRIGMKQADVFGSLYIMSPCCLSPRVAGPLNPELAKTIEEVKTPQDAAKLPFFARALLASAAAWSPNPKNSPLYLDLPIKNGVMDLDVLAKWTANAPLAFADQLEICAATALSRSMLAIRMVYELMLRSCIHCLINMASRTGLNCIRVLTRVRWQSVFKTMCCHFSVSPCVLTQVAARFPQAWASSVPTCPSTRSLSSVRSS